MKELLTKSNELMKARNHMRAEPTSQSIDSFLLTFVRFVNYAKRSEFSDIVTQQETYLRNDICHTDSAISMNSTVMRRILECVDSVSTRVSSLL